MTAEGLTAGGWAAGWGLGGYLLGSIPVAWLLTWLVTGRDLRRMGSGNVGVMNTALSVHRWAGLLVFVAEIAKGVVAVLLPLAAGAGAVAVGLCALGAFVGTRWPIWLRFHGGRGNTCAAASMVLIAPLAVLVVAVLWFGVRWLGASNIAATRALAVALPPATLLATFSWWWAAVAFTYSLLFLANHEPSTDDHLIIAREFPSLWAFLTAPPRRRRFGLRRSER